MADSRAVSQAVVMPDFEIAPRDVEPVDVTSVRRRYAAAVVLATLAMLVALALLAVVS